MILDSLGTGEDETVCEDLAHSSSSLDLLCVSIFRSHTSLLPLCLGGHPLVLYCHPRGRSHIWRIAAHRFPRIVKHDLLSHFGLLGMKNGGIGGCVTSSANKGI